MHQKIQKNTETEGRTVPLIATFHRCCTKYTRDDADAYKQQNSSEMECKLAKKTRKKEVGKIASIKTNNQKKLHQTTTHRKQIQ